MREALNETLRNERMKWDAEEWEENEMGHWWIREEWNDTLMKNEWNETLRNERKIKRFYPVGLCPDTKTTARIQIYTNKLVSCESWSSTLTMLHYSSFPIPQNVNYWVKSSMIDNFPWGYSHLEWIQITLPQCNCVFCVHDLDVNYRTDHALG